MRESGDSLIKDWEQGVKDGKIMNDSIKEHHELSSNAVTAIGFVCAAVSFTVLISCLSSCVDKDNVKTHQEKQTCIEMQGTWELSGDSGRCLFLQPKDEQQ